MDTIIERPTFLFRSYFKLLDIGSEFIKVLTSYQWSHKLKRTLVFRFGPGHAKYINIISEFNHPLVKSKRCFSTEHPQLWTRVTFAPEHEGILCGGIGGIISVLLFAVIYSNSNFSKTGVGILLDISVRFIELTNISVYNPKRSTDCLL
uniref:Uncharacterized protein n=1 Tax=Meloidogyne incognita TaxID=6306 RepID=A0A914ME24_MELIC